MVGRVHPCENQGGFPRLKCRGDEGRRVDIAASRTGKPWFVTSIATVVTMIAWLSDELKKGGSK